MAVSPMSPRLSPPPYPTYKSSSIEWLGDVPAHWEVEKGKWLFIRMDRSVRGQDEVVTCFRDGIVTLRKNRRTLGFTESLKEIGYQGIRKGDLVIHAMDGSAGAIGVSDSDGKGSPVYSVCTPKPQSDAHYFAYLLREMARRGWIQALAKGIRERSTDFRFTEFAKQQLPLPPLQEQRAIARYLDYMDSRIQRYIRAKERLIELLEEQKRVVINQTVTRGLDPDVSLKPSGVEWLGDVPVHWEVVRLGRIGNFSKAGGGTKDDNVETGIPCIRYGDLYTSFDFTIEASRNFITEERSEDYKPLKYGDILFTGSGETIDEIGKSAVNLLSDGSFGGGDLIIFRADIEVDPRFMGYASDCFQSVYQKACMGRGITIMHIYAAQLKNLWLGLPPIEEQRSIGEFIETALADNRDAQTRVRQQIELMKEYRTRMIADVVTGKLDVREAAAGLPEDEGDVDVGV